MKSKSYAEQVELAVRMLGTDRRAALTQLRSMERDPLRQRYIEGRIMALDTPKRSTGTTQAKPDFIGQSRQPLRDLMLYDIIVKGDASAFRRLLIQRWKLGPDHVQAWLDQWGLKPHPLIADLLTRSMADEAPNGTKLKRPGI